MKKDGTWVKTINLEMKFIKENVGWQMINIKNIVNLHACIFLYVNSNVSM